MAARQPLGGTAIKPEGWDRSGCEAFKYFLYNPDTGAILSRTPMSWAKIILFYCVYYSLLACFWMACLNIFFLTLPEGQPRWTQNDSLIGVNPGLGMKPGMPKERVDSSLYLLAAASEDFEPTNEKGEGEKNADFAVRLKLFYDKYNVSSGTSLVDCSAEPNEVRPLTKPNCQFDIEEALGKCAEWPFGYVVDRDYTNYAQPCIILKLNKIFNWEPKPVRVENLDKKEYKLMDQNLKNRIRKSQDKNFVWIDCRGRYPADREVIDLEYFPSNQGMPIKYFPYRGGEYQQPIVAVKAKIRKDSEGMPKVDQLVHVECRAWYDNVKHSTKDMSGLIRFELMLEGRS